MRRFEGGAARVPVLGISAAVDGIAIMNCLLRHPRQKCKFQWPDSQQRTQVFVNVRAVARNDKYAYDTAGKS